MLYRNNSFRWFFYNSVPFVIKIRINFVKWKSLFCSNTLLWLLNFYHYISVSLIKHTENLCILAYPYFKNLVEIFRVSDPDPYPDPDQDPHGSAIIWAVGSGSGSRREKMTQKKIEKRTEFSSFEVLDVHFWGLKGFSCSLGVLYGGLGISKLQFLIKKIKIKFLVNFFQF
jgi:hypothetical protein